MAQPGDREHGPPPGPVPGQAGWPPPPPYPPTAYPQTADPPPGWAPPPWPPPDGRWPAPPDGRWPAPPDGRWPAPPLPATGGRFLDQPGAAPATPGAAGFWVVMGLVGFVVGQIVATIFLAIGGAVSGQSDMLSRYATMAAPPEWYVGTSLVGLWVGFFFGPWVASRARGTRSLIADFGIRFRPVDLAGIAIGVGGQYLIDLLYSPFIKHLKHFTAPTQKLVGASHGWGYVVIAVLTVCGAPFFEELLFRGLLFKAFARLFTPSAVGPSTRRAVGVVLAVVVDGLVFGLAHWELYQFAGLALFGMVLAVVSYKTNRLGMNMVAHASFNLVAVIAVAASASGAVH